MQNPRVSLPSVGAREVCHGNTRPTTRTARFFPVHKTRQTEMTKDSRSKWRLWPLRPAVSCTRDGADWTEVVAVGAQQPISDFFGFIQIRDTLSTNGEHHRVAEVKSFPAIPKSMRSVNGDRNGANLKKWSVLLVCTIDEFRMVLGGQPTPCFFTTEFAKSNFLPCRSSTITRSCEARPMG